MTTKHIFNMLIEHVINHHCDWLRRRQSQYTKTNLLYSVIESTENLTQ